MPIKIRILVIVLSVVRPSFETSCHETSEHVMQAPAGQRELEGMDALLDLPMDDDCLNLLLGSSGADARPADKVQVRPDSRCGQFCSSSSIQHS